LLNHANAILIGSLELDLTLQSIAELLVPDLADWCVVDLLEDGVLHPVARAHSDPEKLAWAAVIQDEFPPDMEAPLGPPNVVRTGEPELYADITDDLLLSVAEGDERLLEVLREVGYRSVIVVPLIGRRGVIGTMTLVMSESRRTYDEKSLGFAVRIGAQLAVAIETAQLHTSLTRAWQAQKEAVDTLQRGLAPDPLPHIPGMTFAAHYEIGGTEGVGGDWYDVISRGTGRVNFVMGDVVGRGVPAVAAMSRYRNSLRALLLEGHSPGRALTILNGLNHDESGLSEGFATVACLEYHLADRSLTWAAAGHLPALVRDRDGVRPLWEIPGPPLDVQPGYVYTEGKGTLNPGAMLVLYTDGFIERRAEPIDQSLDRLMSQLRKLSSEPEFVLKHLLEVLPGYPSDDDVAVLIAQIE
jgi:serine phosphatase RsbU (regulator of sigma subunit)